jgi:hypothetical protein
MLFRAGETQLKLPPLGDAKPPRKTHLCICSRCHTSSSTLPGPKSLHLVRFFDLVITVPNILSSKALSQYRLLVLLTVVIRAYLRHLSCVPVEFKHLLRRVTYLY